jgi:hypothetical protein
MRSWVFLELGYAAPVELRLLRAGHLVHDADAIGLTTRHDRLHPGYVRCSGRSLVRERLCVLIGQLRGLDVCIVRFVSGWIRHFIFLSRVNKGAGRFHTCWPTSAAPPVLRTELRPAAFLEFSCSLSIRRELHRARVLDHPLNGKTREGGRREPRRVGKIAEALTGVRG